MNLFICLFSYLVICQLLLLVTLIQLYFHFFICVYSLWHLRLPETILTGLGKHRFQVNVNVNHALNSEVMQKTTTITKKYFDSNCLSRFCLEFLSLPYLSFFSFFFSGFLIWFMYSYIFYIRFFFHRTVGNGGNNNKVRKKFSNIFFFFVFVCTFFHHANEIVKQ